MPTALLGQIVWDLFMDRGQSRPEDVHKEPTALLGQIVCDPFMDRWQSRPEDVHKVPTALLGQIVWDLSKAKKTVNQC